MTRCVAYAADLSKGDFNDKKNAIRKINVSAKSRSSSTSPFPILTPTPPHDAGDEAGPYAPHRLLRQPADGYEKLIDHLAHWLAQAQKMERHLRVTKESAVVAKCRLRLTTTHMGRGDDVAGEREV